MNTIYNYQSGFTAGLNRFPGEQHKPNPRETSSNSPFPRTNQVDQYLGLQFRIKMKLKCNLTRIGHEVRRKRNNVGKQLLPKDG